MIIQQPNIQHKNNAYFLYNAQFEHLILYYRKYFRVIFKYGAYI